MTSTIEEAEKPSSCWFTELPLEYEDQQETKNENIDKQKTEDKLLEDKILKEADSCCFAQYLVDKLPTQQQQTNAKSSSSSSSSFSTSSASLRQQPPSSIVKVHVVDQSSSSSLPASNQSTPQLSPQKSSKLKPAGDVDRENQDVAEEDDDENNLAPRTKLPSPSLEENNAAPIEAGKQEHEDETSSPVSSREQQHSTNSNSDKKKTKKFKASYFAQNLNSYFSKFSSAENNSEENATTSQQQRQDNSNNSASPLRSKSPSLLSSSASLMSNLQTVVPEDAFLRPLPVSSALSSVQNQQQQQALRKQYEPQIQTLEIKNLPGFVVFADVVLLQSRHDFHHHDNSSMNSSSSAINSRSPGSSGRFLLLSTYPLFDEDDGEEENNEKDERNINNEKDTGVDNDEKTVTQGSNKDGAKPNNITSATSTTRKYRASPTGWRIVYFAPRNCQLRLRVVILKHSSDLLQNNLVDVVAFGSNQKSNTGATRCCVEQECQERKEEENNKENNDKKEKWIITCGGGGIANLQTRRSRTKSSVGADAVTPVPCLPLSFLRPVGNYHSSSSSNNNKNAEDFSLTGFEVGISSMMMTPGNSSTNALASLLLQQQQQKSNNNNSNNNSGKLFDQNLFAWVIAIKRRQGTTVDTTNKNKLIINIDCNLSSCVQDPAFNLSWMLNVSYKNSFVDIGDGDEKQQQQEGDDDVTIKNSSVTLLTGQVPASSPQLLSAKSKWNAWLVQYHAAIQERRKSFSSLSSSSSPITPPAFSESSNISQINVPSSSSASAELKNVPPEFWHAQRRVNSQNVVKKGFTDLMMAQ